MKPIARTLFALLGGFWAGQLAGLMLAPVWAWIAGPLIAIAVGYVVWAL